MFLLVENHMPKREGHGRIHTSKVSLLRRLNNSKREKCVGDLTWRLSVLKRFFLVDDGLELKVQRRGAAPAGGGQVLFTCPIRKLLRPQQVLDQGKIKRVRGVAWATRVSPAVANRMIESAKGVLLKFIPGMSGFTYFY